MVKSQDQEIGFDYIQSKVDISKDFVHFFYTDQFLTWFVK